MFCDGTNAELVAFALGDIDTIDVERLSQTAYNAIPNKSNTTMYLVPV